MTDTPDPPDRKRRSRSRRVGDGFVRPFACTQCSKAFTRNEHLQRHLLNRKYTSCLQFLPLMAISLDQSSQKWTCTKCLAEFVRRDLYQRHCNVAHNDEQSGSETVIDIQSPVQTHEDESIMAVDWSTGQNTGVSPIRVREHVEPYMAPYPSGFDQRFVPLTTANDLEWLFDASYFANTDYGTASSMLPDPFIANGERLEEASTTSRTCYSSPDLSRRSQISRTPRCKWRVCNAINESWRLELLLYLKDSFSDRTLVSDIFSLESLQAGVHFYSRYIAREYSFFHPRVLFPEVEEVPYINKHYGQEAPPQLAWAIITLGWMTFEREERNPELVYASRTIQRAIRVSLMSIVATTSSPPIWVIQAFFLTLVYARYHGEPDESGTAPTLHGVLINLVRRLDLADVQSTQDLPTDNLTLDDYYRWVRIESLKRIVFQTFILDVQQTILFGENSSMSPFEINMRLPCAESLWIADTFDEWTALIRKTSQTPPFFLNMLKQFWNMPTSKTSATISAGPGDARVVLHGVISIASETWRRRQDAYASKLGDAMNLHSARIITSFQSWIAWWNGDAKQYRLTNFVWRNCHCLYSLAHTLCEITASDLQIVAGRSKIQGRQVTPNERARAIKKTRSWRTTEASATAVSEAARIVLDFLNPAQEPFTHCHHCDWSLYLAGLVIYNYVFAQSFQKQQDGASAVRGGYIDARSTLECIIGLGTFRREDVTIADVVTVLAAITQILEREYSGILEEALEVLKVICDSASIVMSVQG